MKRLTASGAVVNDRNFSRCQHLGQLPHQGLVGFGILSALCPFMTSASPVLMACASILRSVVSTDAWTWLTSQGNAIAAGDQRSQATSIALVPRYVGKDPVSIPDDRLEPLYSLIKGADTSRWTIDQWARLFILLHIPAAEPAQLVAALNQLFRCADVAEALAMYQALPYLPYPSAHLLRAREGMRSNQLPLVAAVALDNPYPQEHFDEEAWNQLILKCLFVSLPLKRVQGLDARSNPRLSHMLIDYAKERRSAARPIPIDLWRAAAPCADDQQIAFIAATFLDGVESARQQAAAALALALSPHPAASQALASSTKWSQAVLAGEVTWDNLDHIE